MKRKFFLLSLCLFLGAASFQLSAQDVQSKARQFWTTGTFYTPVWCDGEMVDYVRGNVRVHWIYFGEPGNWKWDILQIKGEATSLITGAVFKYKEIDRITWLNGEYGNYDTYTWRYHLIGKKGEHYIGFAEYDPSTGIMTPIRTQCH